MSLALKLKLWRRTSGVGEEEWVELSTRFADPEEESGLGRLMYQLGQRLWLTIEKFWPRSPGFKNMKSLVTLEDGF